MKSSSILDVLRSRKMTALLLLGFASGLPSQALEGPLQLWLKEQQVPAPAITALYGAATFPYAWKFLWSPVLDRYVPPFLKNFGRRQSWLLLTQVILIGLLILMALQNPNSSNLAVFTVLAVLVGFFSASQDIAGDAYRTDVLDDRERGTGAALWTNGFRVAILIAGNLIIGLADETKASRWSWNQIYLLMAALLVPGILATLWAPKVADNDRAMAPKSLADAVVLPFQDFLQRKQLLGGTAILLFIFSYKLNDYMVKAVSKLFLKDIGFTATDIGNTGAIGIVAAIIGALVGGIIMLRIGMNRALWFAAISQAIGILPYVLLAQLYPIGNTTQPDVSLLLFAVISESFAAGLEAAVFVAYMMSLCNQKFSATQFALFSSFMLASRSFIVGPMGGIYKSFGGLNFFWLSVFATIPSLLILLYVAPLNAGRLLKKGVEKRRSHNLTGAIDEFNHVIDLQPKNAEAFRQRGLTQAQLGQISYDREGQSQVAIVHYASAISDLKKSLAIRPNEGSERRELQDVETAAKLIYNRAIDSDPTQAHLYGERGVIHADLGDPMLAKADLDRAIELNPQDVRFYEDRGKVLYRLGHLDEALVDFQQAVALDAKDPEHLRNLALVQYHLGQFSEALHHAQQALALNPRSRQLAELLHTIQARL